MGGQTLDIRIRPIDEGPFGTDYTAHKEIVRSDVSGAEPGHSDTPSVQRGDKRYAHTGLDLASHVRDDPSYQQYLLAALQLFDWDVPFASEIPYRNNGDIHPYIDAGAVSM